MVPGVYKSAACAPRASPAFFGPPMPRRFALSLGALPLVAFALSGCGHPATDAECREILGRIVELELKAQKVTDAGEIQKRREELEANIAAGKSGPYEGCVGKRIRDSQLECVRAAESSAEITGTCLR